MKTVLQKLKIGKHLARYSEIFDKRTLCSLKIFLEKCTFFHFDFIPYYRLFNQLCYGFPS